MDATEFQATAEKIVSTIKDPAELKRQLTELVEPRFAMAPVFRSGEPMALHEFESRFKRGFCAGNETRYAQWPVLVFEDKVNGELMLFFGVTLTGKCVMAQSNEAA